MNRRTPQILALIILMPATIWGSIAHAQEMFKLLGEKEIRNPRQGRRQGHYRQLSLGELSPTRWRASQQRNGSKMDRDLENPEQQTLHVEPKPGVARLR